MNDSETPLQRRQEASYPDWKPLPEDGNLEPGVTYLARTGPHRESRFGRAAVQAAHEKRDQESEDD